MVIIKIDSLPGQGETLKGRVEKSWSINIDRLSNEDTLIALYEGQILQIYKILGYKKDYKEKDSKEKYRVAFELKEINNPFKVDKLNYKTRNPCTIINLCDISMYFDN